MLLTGMSAAERTSWPQNVISMQVILDQVSVSFLWIVEEDTEDAERWNAE